MAAIVATAHIIPVVRKVTLFAGPLLTGAFGVGLALLTGALVPKIGYFAGLTAPSFASSFLSVRRKRIRHKSFFHFTDTPVASAPEVEGKPRCS
ncbi:hypothetical protein [uncultured Erythrobacter sp.]|uniref:hypothetical protein n=1 Tax=uncultured Erythrobacter sp. TaxID=263913 RepID=UPI002637EC2E|nr:hypothetical protein [uncultured Erythrobacter sp.]